MNMKVINCYYQINESEACHLQRRFSHLMFPMTSSRPYKNSLYGIEIFVSVQDRQKPDTHTQHLGYTIQGKILMDDTKTKN